jgi:nucleotide sugar dehydrogenase
MSAKYRKLFIQKVTDRKAVVGIIGLGYVGLPLAIAFAKSGFPVIGYDVDPVKIDSIRSGKSYVKHISGNDVRDITANGGSATSDIAELANADTIIICVPTPLTKQREPDMHFIQNTGDMLSDVIRPGQLIVLESTTYPGTTREVLLPRLEKRHLKAGKDFMLAYSPEREDPGAKGHSAHEIPKVVGGLTEDCLEAACALYNEVVPQTVRVSSPEAAEATKLMENIFRCVNIALVNELKQVFMRMGLDIWEIVDAAKSKPFGFMPFYPGPGLGGHCIPIDPFYLTWKAREFECSTRFIELAGEINTSMPEYVLRKTMEGLNEFQKSLKGSNILLVGMAYKKDVDDIRESPSLRLMELYIRYGATVEYHDPFVVALKKTRNYSFAKKSVALTEETVSRADAVVIATNHTDTDYGMIGRAAKLVIDTRNAMAGVDSPQATIIKA